MPTNETEQGQVDIPAAATAGATATAPLSIVVEYADRVNFAMQQNGVPLVERVSLTNTGQMPLKQIKLTISLENDQCEPWTGRIDCINPQNTYHVEPHDLRMSGVGAQRRAVVPLVNRIVRIHEIPEVTDEIR